MPANDRAGKLGSPGRAFCVLLVLGCTLLATGCTRHFFRKRADEEVDEVLCEKDRYPAWRIDQWHVYPDPRARFADPTNPDRPPTPPDDPAAFDLAPNPQKPGKAGVAAVQGEGYLKLLAYWDAENRAAQAREREKTKEVSAVAENPEEGVTKAGSAGVTTATKASVTTSLSSSPDQKPPYLINLEQSVELGLINSREYQDAREDLYLTALPVTLERFAFAAQFFAAGEAVREWAGPGVSGGSSSGGAAAATAAASAATTGTGGASAAAAAATAASTPRTGTNSWALSSNVGFSKLFSTGALLLFNFANQTVFNLTGSGGRALTSQSTINLSLVQPFLRGGGQAVTLEPLTQVERNLVYQIRNYARFRKSFYVAIAGGGGGSITGANFQPTGVLANSTFSPAAGVAGSSGLLPGVVPLVPVTGTRALEVNPGTAGSVSLQTALAAQVSGYLTTLLQAAQIRVDIYNIEKLEGFLKLARALQEGGDISQLQTDQFEQQVLLRRTNLLTDQFQYLQALDQFKLQLGIPTNVPLEQDDTDFRPLNEQFQRYEDLFNAYKAASEAPARVGTPEAVPRVRAELRRLFTTSSIVRGTRFQKQIEADWDAWHRLSGDDLRKELARYGAERRRLLDRKAEAEAKEQTLPPAEQERLDRVEFEIVLGQLEAELRQYEGRPWTNVTDPEVRRRAQQTQFRYVVNLYVLVLTAARNERIVQLRSQWPDLRRVCVNGIDLLKADLEQAQEAVVQVGLTNRLDLMNVRGTVVDAWRQLAVFANALLAPFNVQYSLSSSTPAGLNQPFDFSANRTQQQLIFNTELPLVRKAERNRYRASLINFQRFRRILQRAEDQVMFDVRGELRTLRQQADLYRIQQRQIELSYMTVENALDTFLAPPAAGAVTVDQATRAASLTTQLINAQTQLFNAQTQMTAIWITYLNTRLQLYRDMELMQLDEKGSWVDNVAECLCPPGETPAGTAKTPAGGTGGTAGQRPEELPAPQPAPPPGTPPAQPGAAPPRPSATPPR